MTTPTTHTKIPTGNAWGKIPDVADYWDVHYNTVYRMIRDGRLKAIRIGRTWRVDWDDVAAVEITGER